MAGTTPVILRTPRTTRLEMPDSLHQTLASTDTDTVTWTDLELHNFMAKQLETPEVQAIASRDTIEHDQAINAIARHFELDKMLSSIEPSSDLDLAEICERYDMPETLRLS
ncbi:uncharacterized protein FSUBG_6277 [Fusarium subglutinans]|uniref:Uncharacterized protein n=1 Tax=Gibberella subglutinans TaxID=42677 RepID=A0A8H5V0D7_GIBSU|nr:uncharacterized protein FSUBG_6277 [Fusarium subglutinans]KAF5605941.1 hypothetical protein FSUBG_6277 [Fusarium subglutinans]